MIAAHQALPEAFMREIWSIKSRLVLAALCASVIALMPSEAAAQRIIKVRDLDSLAAPRPAAQNGPAQSNNAQPPTNRKDAGAELNVPGSLTCIAGCATKR
jgi:hypothetical protein